MINARKMSSAMSAAKAASDHMRDWFLGTEDGLLFMARNIHHTHPWLAFSRAIRVYGGDKRWQLWCA